MTIHHGLLLERLNDKDTVGNPHRPKGCGETRVTICVIQATR